MRSILGKKEGNFLILDCSLHKYKNISVLFSKEYIFYMQVSNLAVLCYGKPIKLIVFTNED